MSDAGDQDAPAQRQPRVRQPAKADRHQGADKNNVQQDRRRGGGDETLERIEYAAQHRRQRHEHKIGKGQAGEIDRKLELLRVVAKSASDHAHDLGHEDFYQQAENDQHAGHNAEDTLGELARGGATGLRQLTGEQWHEGGVKCPFGEQPAEDVGQLQRHEEGIGNLAGAEQARDQNIADKSQHPAAHGPAADGGNRSK